MKIVVILLSIVILFSCTTESKYFLESTSHNDGIENALDHDVIIVGAGIAGLSAAYELYDDYDIMVLEKEPIVGGRALAGTYKGFTYAKGAEYTGNPEGQLKKMLTSLNINPIEIPSPADGVYHEGNFIYGDNDITKMLVDQSSVEQFNRFRRAVVKDAEYDDERLTADQYRIDAMTVEEYFDTLELDDFYYTKFNTALKGLFGANIKEMSALASLWELAYEVEGYEDIEEISDLDQNDLHTGVYSFIGGLSGVTAGLGEYLQPVIKTSATVLSIEKGDNFIEVTFQSEVGIETLRAELVIIATPAPVTAKIATNVLSPETLNILTSIEYAPYITVALMSEKPIFNKAFDLAVYDAFFTDVYDATWVQRHSDPSIPPIGITSLYIASDSYKDRSLLSLTDVELLDRIYRDLEKLFPGSSSTITGYDIHRFKYAYPVIPPGGYSKLLQLRELNKGTVLLAGDYLTYPTFEEAARSGFIAAELAQEELET